jgi:hypothetical protein
MTKWGVAMARNSAVVRSAIQWGFPYGVPAGRSLRWLARATARCTPRADGCRSINARVRTEDELITALEKMAANAP